MKHTTVLLQKKYALHYLVRLLFVCFSVNTNAQSSKLLISENNFKTSPPPENIETLNIAYQERAVFFTKFPQFDKDSAMFYFNKSIQLLEENQPTNFKRLAEVYSKITVFKYHSHNFVSGDSMVKKALAYYEKIAEPKNCDLLLYTILYHQTMIYIEFGEFKTAQDIFIKASNLIVNETKPEVQAQIYLDRGFYYMRFSLKREIKLAGENAEKSFKIYDAMGSPEKYKALLMMNYAKVLSLPTPMNSDTVKFYFKIIKDILPHVSDIDSHLRFYGYFGQKILTLNQLKEAKSLLFESLNFFEHYKLTSVNSYESVNAELGFLAAKEGNKEAAFNYYIKSGEVALAINTRASKSDYYEMFSTAYETKGDFAEALRFHKLYLDGQIDLITEQNDKSLKETELQLNVARQEKEISQKNEQQDLLIGATLFALLSTGAFAFVSYREWRNRTKLQVQKNIIEQQSEVLKQLDATKTRFFANVSHELRTPLTLMLAPLGTMLKSNMLDNRNFTLATLARQHSQQLLSLVNEILDLTKLESGKMVTHEEPIEIYAFLRRLIATFESYAAQRGIKLIFNFDRNLPHALMLDKPKFEKIFNNLLSNSLKFTPNGGSITIRVTHTPSDWQLAVIDTGRGIHPDDLPHVFNRFYQTNQTDAPIEGGTGIGLALSNELAQVMNGKLSVQSTLGNGATFILELPKHEVLGNLVDSGQLTVDGTENDLGTKLSTFNQPLSPGHSTVNHQLSTIMVVEDNPSLRNYIKLILSDKYNVVTAENGEDALKIVDSCQLTIDRIDKHLSTDHHEAIDNHQVLTKIDLIVSDIMMPVMDGFQLLEKLKNDDVMRSIPVVMLTARAEMQDKLKALTFGVDDYLIKPFEEDELFARIKNLLSNVAARRDAFNRVSLNTEDAFEEINAPITNNAVSHNAIADNTITSVTINPLSTEDKEWLDDLEKTVRAHISDFNLSAESLAELMFLSRSQFFRRVQTLVGLTPLQYIQEIRFNHARTVLEQRQLQSVKAVASAIGVHKTQYFSEQFKERFGKSPSEYFL